jgi:hypothetical protein
MPVWTVDIAVPRRRTAEAVEPPAGARSVRDVPSAGEAGQSLAAWPQALAAGASTVGGCGVGFLSGLRRSS